MDTGKLKSFAPEARLRLQEQVGAKLDYVLGADTAELREKAAQVKAIRKASGGEGREAYLERIAYTWFNRLVAIRYMELHGYLDHGYRVLSHPEGQGRPEILDHAEVLGCHFFVIAVFLLYEGWWWFCGRQKVKFIFIFFPNFIKKISRTIFIIFDNIFPLGNKIIFFCNQKIV